MRHTPTDRLTRGVVSILVSTGIRMAKCDPNCCWRTGYHGQCGSCRDYHGLFPQTRTARTV